MIPLEAGPPPWELLGGILASVAALITALAGVAKVLTEVRSSRAEVRELRAKAEETAATASAVLEQQHTNHGSTLRDDVKATLAATKGNAAAITGVQRAQQRQDAELARIQRQLTQMDERMTQADRHVTDQLSDHSERIRAVETLTIRREVQT